MDVRTKIEIGIAAALVAILCIVCFQHKRIEQLSGERDKYRNNTETLLGDIETYRVADSLSAARVQALELSVSEFERFRAEDAKLVAELKARNRDLVAVNTAQARTIVELQSAPRDTVVVRDSVEVPAIAVHCGDAWYDFNGVLTRDSFTGTLVNRESLVLAETVQYRRFLGFLWKTKEVKDRQVDVVSKNPHTQIMGVEYITTSK